MLQPQRQRRHHTGATPRPSPTCSTPSSIWRICALAVCRLNAISSREVASMYSWYFSWSACVGGRARRRGAARRFAARATARDTWCVPVHPPPAPSLHPGLAPRPARRLPQCGPPCCCCPPGSCAPCPGSSRTPGWRRSAPASSACCPSRRGGGRAPCSRRSRHGTRGREVDGREETRGFLRPAKGSAACCHAL